MREKPEIADAYADPLVYDVLHTPGTAQELNALERIATRFVLAGHGDPRTLRWLEPCCGTGRFLRLLARRGVRVAGVELDANVAGYANSRLTSQTRRLARAVVGDMRDLDRLEYPRGFGPSFDFAFSPHNSIRHLATPADLTRHLRAVAKVLRPRGVYAVGVGLQPDSQAIVGEDVHEGRRGGLRVGVVCQYFETPRRDSSRGPRRERVVSFTTITHGYGRTKSTRTIESVYDLLCISPSMWMKCVHAAGLREAGIVDDERARDLPLGRVDYAYRVLALRP